MNIKKAEKLITNLYDETYYSHKKFKASIK